MSDYKPLDGTADVLPVGLQPTPFGEVWQALQQVAADVWNVDPSVYRAGMAWLWYAVNHPGDLASDSLRALLVAALISEQAPMVKDWQTNAELVEYLRVWRTYSPTYAKLEAIFATFGARVEVRPISDAESQGVVPVTDRRLAFYLRAEEFDAERPLTLDEVYQIAVRATPLGSRPVPYFALVGSSDVFAGPASAGLVRALWASEPAEPVTPPTPAYTEITLYMASGNKQAQKQVTSGFTGNANATYCYQLYVDDQLTTPWAGYDYSNNYELGSYSGGVWIPWTMTSVSSLPSTYTSDSTQWKMAYILMDNGFLWLASNVSGSGYMSFPSEFILLRIYPKGQQWIPVFPYNPSYGEYDNLSVTRKGTFVRMGSPATVFGTFPAIAESFGYKSGMIKTASIQTELQISQATLYIIVVGNPALSNIIVRFENDICTGYVRSDKADLPTSPSYDGATYTLMDDNGTIIDYDDSFTYKFVLLLNSTGDTVGGTTSTGSMKKSSTGKLQVRIRYMSSKFNRVWYYKKPSATVSKEGNFGQYNWVFPPDLNTVLQPGESCVLDDSGTPGTTYAYDSTKSYGVFQWQTESGIRAGATELQIVGIEQGGQTIIGCKNASSASVTVSYVRVCVCSSSSATVVSVYDSSNVAYNAFKLSLSGTDYYYVLDNTQTAWVIDLSSIGYSLSPITT